MNGKTSNTVLLTGATGFVGGNLPQALARAGYSVRCASRRPQSARRRSPGTWTRLDLGDPRTYAPALRGCQAVIYLVHSIGEGADYARKEARQAADFRREAEQTGVERIIYLGGVCPPAGRSRHLDSRRMTGEALRSERLATFELRAAMIIGRGSAGWELVHSLARLPILPRPPWMNNTSRPIGIADVVRAIVGCLSLPAQEAGCFELDGPRSVTHAELMSTVARALGREPRFLPVPWLPRRLSSRGLAVLSGQNRALLHELLEGIQVNLEPEGPSIWERLDATPESLETSIASALEGEPARYLLEDAYLSGPYLSGPELARVMI